MKKIFARLFVQFELKFSWANSRINRRNKNAFSIPIYITDREKVGRDIEDFKKWVVALKCLKNIGLKNKNCLILYIHPSHK